MIFILVPRGSQDFRKGRHGECDVDYSNVNCSRSWCPVCIIIVMSSVWRRQVSWMVQVGPSVITGATDQLLLTDHGNCPQCPQTCPGNEGPACKPANLCRYLDSWYKHTNDHSGLQIIRPTHRALFGWFCTFSIGIHDLDWFLKPNISKYHHHRIRLIKLDDLSIPGGISCSLKILGRECRLDNKMISWILFLFLMTRTSAYWPPLTRPTVFYSWSWRRQSETDYSLLRPSLFGVEIVDKIKGGSFTM